MADGTATATGVERIAATFAAAREQDRAALMPYLMGGFPDLAGSALIADAYADGGADLIELGIPFSDPLADGPVIHAAGTEALATGATVEAVLEACAPVASRVPVLAMTYVNTIMARGPQPFAELLGHHRISGAIVPDLPLEESGEIHDALNAAGLALVPMVAPTTPAERRRRICADAGGFVYVVSDVGVTGERDELPASLTELVAAVREEASVPAAVGFGIGTPEQAATVGRIADGVIVGTRLVRAAADAPDATAASRAVGEFVRAAHAAMG
jgi:tryptophan synthase alpha chain